MSAYLQMDQLILNLFLKFDDDDDSWTKNNPVFSHDLIEKLANKIDVFFKTIFIEIIQFLR
jgi:hypothetical protein